MLIMHFFYIFNVFLRGINGSAKREELVDAFRKEKFELLALIRDKVEWKWKSIMVWRKWYHCQCSEDGKS